MEPTPAGLVWAEAGLEERKVVFAEHFLQRIRVPEGWGLNRLKEHLPEPEAKRVLSVLLEWGRYAGPLAYHEGSGIPHLPPPFPQPLG